ncbi:MAG: nitrogen fixation protein NifZ [Candidatus Accumulibacter phosphatis]|uniref:nitrogen fixation protein NifZ n=1 Tax=Candidatus Accumulibacter sp. ACC012 TaxID=2823332 RepID=UPI0025C43F9D|nr:nitrogen fixation protein NifZ [Candidatus Accumulibacter sp. ACC012]
MAIIPYQTGDLVFAAEDIFNDGGVPGIEAQGLIAAAGSRGVIIDSGVAAMDDSREVYLVRFESGPEAILGNPVGCLPEELTQDPVLAA